MFKILQNPQMEVSDDVLKPNVDEDLQAPGRTVLGQFAFLELVHAFRYNGLASLCLTGKCNITREVA